MKKFILYVITIGILISHQKANADDCFTKVATDSQIAPLEAKIALVSPEKTPFAMLSDASKPTKKEKQLIAAWMNKLETCIATDPDYKLEGIHPSLVAVVNEYLDKFKLASADLYAGKITYGEYAQHRLEMADSFKKGLNSATTQLSMEENQQKQREEAQAQQDKQIEAQKEIAQQQIAAQEEAARKRAALEFLMRNQPVYTPPPVQFQPIPTLPPHQIRNTTCNTYGSTTNCTSY